MNRFQFRSSGAVTALFLLLALGPAACGGGDAEPAADEQEAVDREMDMALEDRDAEPELQDVPQAEPPARQAPPRPQAAPPAQTPRPQAAPPAREEAVPEPPAEEPAADPGPAPRTISAPAGTTFRVELTEELSTRTNRVGDSFTVRLIDPITDGRVVVAPTETTVRGKVTALQKSGGSGEPAVIKVAFQDIFVEGEWFPIGATVTEASPKTEGRSGTGEKAAKIGGGAVAGAVLGRVVGGNAKGAVIGAAVGAAAGTAITLATEDKDAVLPEGSEMTLELDRPLQVTIYR